MTLVLIIAGWAALALVAGLFPCMLSSQISREEEAAEDERAFASRLELVDSPAIIAGEAA